MFITLTIFFFTNSQVACESTRFITTFKYSKPPLDLVTVKAEPAAAEKLVHLVSIKEELTSSPLNTTYRHLCLGSIVTIHKVLTSAHCFERDNFYFLDHVESLRVVAGNLQDLVEHSRNVSTTPNQQWREIDRIAIHSLFRFPRNDIAMIFVKPHWEFTEYINSAAAAKRLIDYSLPCVTIGFKKVASNDSSNSSSSREVLLARIRVLTRTECNKIFGRNMNKYLCTASYVPDIGSDDSGAPLTCRDTRDTAERSDKDLLVGLVCGKNSDNTTLYTRVAAYESFQSSNDTKSYRRQMTTRPTKTKSRKKGSGSSALLIILLPILCGCCICGSCLFCIFKFLDEIRENLPF